MSKPTFSGEQARARIERLRGALDERQVPEASVLVYGGQSKTFWAVRELDAMFLSNYLGVPTVNGYSGNLVPGYEHDASCARFVSQLAAYDEWARQRGFDSLADLEMMPLLVSLEDCDLTRQISGGK